MQSTYASQQPAFRGGGGAPAPVNTGLPTITGDLIQGGSAIFTPGTWDGSYSLDYRVLKGTVSAPGGTVLLDWTTDTGTLITGIADGDYMWLQERANGSTIATSAAGLGPMVALTPADATIVNTGGVNNVANYQIVTHTFNMTLTAQPAAGFLVCLSSSGVDKGILPTWSGVSVGGVPMTFIESWAGASDAGSRNIAEVWGLWGTDIPSGAVTISGTREATTGISDLWRSAMVGIHIANTQATLPTATDTDFLSSTTDATSWVLNTTTTVDKTLVIGFPNGVIKTGPTAGSPTFTPTTMTSNIQPWPNSRSSGSLHWAGAMSMTVTPAATIDAGFTWVDSSNQLRRVTVPVVRIRGDNYS